MTSLRRAVVTGGASGIGRAAVDRLAQDGVEVITFDLSDEADVVVDITDEQAVAEAAVKVGDVDILVNSAGIIGPNNGYASPPTSDTAYTTPVDGVAGVSTVMDVLSLAVSPDGNTVAWFEGTTNRLRVAKLSGGVWTTQTVAGAYNTYRVDGTGAGAG